jgi:hypothetical protein
MPRSMKPTREIAHELVDAIHLSTDYHATIYEAVWGAVKKCLEEIRKRDQEIARLRALLHADREEEERKVG